MKRALTAAALALAVCAPVAASAGPRLETLSCRDLVDAGWKSMPDVADYVLAKPGSDKLGYGSECHLADLSFHSVGWSRSGRLERLSTR
jgi:hypothetical protein